MPERVARTVIKPEVIEVIAAVARKPQGSITESTDLWRDLGFSKLVKSALAHSYTKISAKHGGVFVTQSTAEKCTSVKDAIDLTYKQANA